MTDDRCFIKKSRKRDMRYSQIDVQNVRFRTLIVRIRTLWESLNEY